MNPIIKFFHELFHPHCPHCLQLEMRKYEETIVEKEIKERIFEEDKRCRSCESLERQLAVANEQIIKLTEKIVNPNPIIPAQNEQQPKPIPRGNPAFHVIRSLKEAESRAQWLANQQAAKPDAEQTEQPKVTSIVEDETFKEMEAAVLNASTQREANAGTAK